MAESLPASDTCVASAGRRGEKPMNLSFLRHGVAADAGAPGATDDHGRPLTDEGREKTVRVAKGLQRLGLVFDLILSSPLVRARETAEIVATALGAKKALKLSERLAPGATLQGLVDELTRDHGRCEEILLIGHEPDFSHHIAVLTSGRPTLQLEMKKAGLCRLQVDELRAGRCATLQWLLPPKLLARLS
jgi:phosphohistidine phosphatase